MEPICRPQVCRSGAVCQRTSELNRTRGCGCQTPAKDQGEADIAVGFFPEVGAELAAQGADAVTRLDHLYRCSYQCVMRHDHPLAATGALTLDSYCAAQHLRVNFASRALGCVDAALARLGQQRRVMLTVNQLAIAGPVVHQSDLLTVLPRSYVPATGYADKLAARALPFELPTRYASPKAPARHPGQAAIRRGPSASTCRLHRQLALRSCPLGRHAFASHPVDCAMLMTFPMLR